MARPQRLGAAHGRRLRRGGAVAVLLSLAAAASAAPPAFEDTMAQRVLACTGCHGAQGRAAADGYYPRIAGKPAGYLANQLRNFRDGRRQYALMNGLVAPLDDAYLAQIADHFAALELPYPAPAPGPALTPEQGALAARLIREGEPSRRVPACTACHGSVMTGTAPFVPGLLGLPRDYLIAQLGAWRTGKRHAQAPDCMAQVAQALTPEQIGAVAAWLAAQPVPAGARPAPAFHARPPLPCGGVGP
ncbi:MAG: c-type cytochrome [Pseudomonadota bacterium]|nr:c-type cytochrome [Pseudomonadota bacterium]